LTGGAGYSDLGIDDHYTNEDVGITLQALGKALGDRKGIVRFGTFLASDGA